MQMTLCALIEQHLTVGAGIGFLSLNNELLS